MSEAVICLCRYVWMYIYIRDWVSEGVSVCVWMCVEVDIYKCVWICVDVDIYEEMRE